MKLNSGKPNLKIWIELENGIVMGPGTYTILRSIIDNGSISAASKVLKISYKKAWSKIKITEERLGETIVVKKRGGASGGKSEITEAGKTLIDTYEKFSDEVKMQAETIYKTHFS